MIAFTDLFFKKQSSCKLQRNFSKSVRRLANLLYSAVQKYATFSIKQATNNYVYYFICYNYNNDIYYYIVFRTLVLLFYFWNYLIMLCQKIFRSIKKEKFLFYRFIKKYTYIKGETVRMNAWNNSLPLDSKNVWNKIYCIRAPNILLLWCGWN